MVSTRFLSIRGSAVVEKKCSLLARLILDTNNRAEHELQLRQNLEAYLSTADKVRLKVGRHAVTITDRTIWQHKVDRIPNSLILDAYIDSEYPQICYLVNETIREEYQVLAFLCKTAEDACKLVKNCGSRSLRILTQSFERESMDDLSEDDSFIGLYRGMNQHSTLDGVASHGNCHAERQPRMSNFPARQYDSGLRGYKTVDDGVARMMVGKGKQAARQRNTRGITFLKSNNRYQQPTQLLQTETRRSNYPVTRRNYSSSSSPKFVEEEFQFVPEDANMGSLSLSRRGHARGAWGDQTDGNRGLNIVRASSEANPIKRRQAPYRSIQEYEEAQRNMTISSSGLHTTSSSENIEPQMSLVLRGNNYTIQDTKWSPPQTSRRPIKVRSSHTRQRNRPAQGLHLIESGRFPEVKLQPAVRSPSAERRRARMYPSALQKQTHSQLLQAPSQFQQPPNQLQQAPSQFQQAANQLQPYTPQTGSESQPKYMVKTHGKGQNFFKNEALEYDDDHKYFRQHGQRVKKTSDGKQQLFLDKRLAETKDIIGDQMVQGKHSQKVQSGESVGANHHSKFHSEVRVSQKMSQPTTIPQFPVEGHQLQSLTPHRKNSQPVKTTTHQWPAAHQFQDPTLHFNSNFAGFQANEPLQRFFPPQHDPTSDMRLNPGFERFFASINDFGPQSGFPKVSDGEAKESSLKMIATKTPTQSADGLRRVDPQSENESETSSIRSSASAYWPPELKFLSAGDGSDAVSRKYRRQPVMKLRRISPTSEKRER